VLAQGEAWSWSMRLCAALLFGVCQAMPLLHTMHDASHLSIGSSPRGWRLLGRLCMDWFAGASMTSWHHQHIVGHHLYTNVLGADPDLPVDVKGDMRRVAPHQFWAFAYKFQAFYLAILYCMLALKFRVQDIVVVVSLQNGPIRVNARQTSELSYPAVTKTCWVAWRFGVALYLGSTLKEAIILFLISEFISGWYLALNFQVSHISPSAAFPDLAEEQSSFKDEWAVSQVKTTVDYGHGSLITAFLCGALNYQTVHHLFPSVSQYHYPAIAPIVMDICKKHKVSYTHIPTFAEALYLHFKHLSDMGVKAIH